MQYTSGSFGDLAAHWFRYVLLPLQVLRRPKRILPSDAFRMQRTPDAVLTRVIDPLGVAILRVSTAVRRLQHGHLHSYILYLVAGLLVLGLVVVLGGKS
jgi:hydrogenase-4 component B